MKPIYGLAAFTLSAMLTAAYAQGDGKTDTGGGMGGTGNSSDKFPMAEIGAEIGASCSEHTAVGAVTRRLRGSNVPSTPERVCSDQLIKTAADDTLVLTFTKGDELNATGNAAFFIRRENSPEIVATVLLLRGDFLISRASDSINYQINPRIDTRSVAVKGENFSVKIRETKRAGREQIFEVVIQAEGTTSIIVKSDTEELVLKPNYSAIARIESDGISFITRKKK